MPHASIEFGPAPAGGTAVLERCFGDLLGPFPTPGKACETRPGAGCSKPLYLIEEVDWNDRCDQPAVPGQQDRLTLLDFTKALSEVSLGIDYRPGP